MLRRQFTRLIGAGAVASALPALISPARAADPLKVGFIYLGPVGDFGWTYQHDIARKAAIEHFGDKIKTTYVENVAEGPDSEKVLNDLANQGHKLIFATSFGYMNYVLNSAKRHPAVFYEHATGYKRAANVSTYNIRFYQGRYVQGIIAGKLSKAGLAGYVGSVPVPEVVQGINAFMLGMQTVNPKARAEVRADQLLVRSAEGRRRGQGADRPGLRHHHPAHRLAGAVAGRGQPWGKGVRPVHRHGEVRHRPQLSASTDVWGPYYIKRIEDVMDGTWKSTDTWGGFESGMLAMSPFTNMPEDVAALATSTVADIKSGKNKVFVGPISDQSGTVKVPAGTTMDDGALSSMQWLVQGVDGKLS